MMLRRFIGKLRVICFATSGILVLVTATACFAEQSLALEKEQVVQGIPCAKGQVWFYDSGKLKTADLSRNIMFDDIVCSLCIDLYESGKLMHTTFPEDREYQGIPVLGGFSVKFYESGKIGAAFLSKDYKAQGIVFPKGTLVTFFESGTIDYAMASSKPIVVLGITFPKQSELYFDESGKLKRALFYEKAGIKGLLGKPPVYKCLYFDDSGNIIKDQEPEDVSISAPKPDKWFGEK